VIDSAASSAWLASIILFAAAAWLSRSLGGAVFGFAVGFAGHSLTLFASLGVIALITGHAYSYYPLAMAASVLAFWGLFFKQ
jgi:hypothetical protein